MVGQSKLVRLVDAKPLGDIVELHGVRPTPRVAR
jgi:hypothetical protein